ncbi:hypothetical protein E2R56_21150 [Rhodococcus qingshengii]|nr:hypothetical protein E2R56_21150 [Rhodococcus qingshengii]
MGGLPPALEEMELTVNIPGHFTVYKPFQVGYLDDDGNITAHWNPELDVEAGSAGDVNKENVIDVLDAIYFTTPEPKESYEGKTLEDILTKLGLN